MNVMIIEKIESYCSCHAIKSQTNITGYIFIILFIILYLPAVSGNTPGL